MVRKMSARFFLVFFGVAFAQFVGTGLLLIGTTGYVNEWLPYVITVVSNIVAIIVYLIYLQRVRNRILHKEKL